LTILDYDLKRPQNIPPEENYFINGNGTIQELENYLYNLKYSNN
jgi:hypothetical protein